MNICFIAAGPVEWGSSRMRAWWVAEALKERGHNVNVINHDRRRPPDSYPKVDVYIWQKVADKFWVDALDARHYWDVCDPSWWWEPNYCREIAEYMTGVVASSQALADDFNQWYGRDIAICIPDRLDLSHFHTQRQHTDVSPVRLIWYGVAVNRIALYGAVANLERLVANGHKIELTICDDRPDIKFHLSQNFPVYHVQWALNKEVDILSSHDIALLPSYPGPWGEVKSNNKRISAWACGLPVWDGNSYELGKLLVGDADTRAGMAYLDLVEHEYTIDESAAEWEALLS